MSIESQWTGQVQAPHGSVDPTEPIDPTDVDLVDVDEYGDGGQADRWGDEVADDDAGSDDQPDSSLPEPPLTGDDAVDRAVAEVARAVIRPLEDQVAVIDAAHRTLQDRLADVEG